MKSEELLVAQAQTVEVQRGTLEMKVAGSGSIEAVTSVDVKALVNDEIDEVLVSSGEEVKEGQELITFVEEDEEIVAPASGIVTSLDVIKGERVTPGQVVMHITNYDDLQVTLQVDELDISNIKEGQEAIINVNAFPDQEYTGTVTSIAREGTVTNGISTFDVTIHIEEPDHLKVGMTAEAHILIERKDDVLYVPIEAVRSMNDEKFVLVEEASSDGEEPTFRRQVVTTGIYNEDYIEIVDGLTEGMTVQLPMAQISQTNRPSFGEGMMIRMPNGGR
ncbi:HlyD family secretion protein [Caldalkalibacillus uzonensis]|uniref:HlyD family secretion protein n=1 Tax=Caldalkalibacillus uzonensis TaxID=353224 RepID=A0ABU0CQ63_9BACI|nr:efflux RND transporter periplasmic adaptor subunit [Caldalkalibacillus uzonensis]MDQ0338044.1 HlyD family secretion protein [Caldalkalibacillus uzonensis]